MRITPFRGPIPAPPGLTPYRYQIRAARWALSRPRSYLALDAGLGKTICAVLIMNASPPGTPFVVVCPPFLVPNWEREIERWSTRRHRVRIVPDSLLHDPFGARPWIGENAERSTLFIDEAHRFKTFTARRTRVLLDPRFGVARRYARTVLLSGTPMPNRPLELFPVLSELVPEVIENRNLYRYGMRYCAGFHTGFGYDFNGSSRLDELGERMRESFMLRIRVKEALPELPPMLEEMLLVDGKLPARVEKLERDILRQFSPEDLMREIAPNDHIATYRRLLGELKVAPTVRVIREILTESNEAVLLFAEHRAVIARLAKELARFKPVVIDGSVSKHERLKLVDRFQSDASHRLVIGNVKACGVGFNLTRASRVVFCEFAWPPGENEQAAKRAHRIGTKTRVLVQYVIFKNSIDRPVMEANLKKRHDQSLI